MTIVIDTQKYLKAKLEGKGQTFPPEILIAMASSLKNGLMDEMPVADGLASYNKELPLEIFEDIGSLKIVEREVVEAAGIINLTPKSFPSRDVNYTRKTVKEFVDLTKLEGFSRSEKVVFI